MDFSSDTKPKTYVDFTFCLDRFVDSNEVPDIQLPQEKLLDDLAIDTLEKRLNTDVVVELGNTTLNCHGVVLRHFSERFAYSLPTGIVISLSPWQITSQSFSMAYEWMLRKEVYCPRCKLLDLLQAAHYLYIPKLAESLLSCLGDRQLYTEAEAIVVYFEAKRRNQTVVAKLLISCLRRHFLPLVCTDEFREMDFEGLAELLESDGLAVQSELEVLYAALYWLFADYEKRQDYTEKLLLTVRFPLLTPRFRLNLASRLHELTPRVADALMPLLHRAMLQHQQTLKGILSELEIKDRQRNWIMDPACPYHNGEEPSTCTVGPMDFLSYLSSLTNVSEFLGRIQEKKVPYLQGTPRRH